MSTVQIDGSHTFHSTAFIHRYLLMDLTILLLFSITGVSVTVARSLHCIPQSNEICDGQEVTCFCTAASNEVIHWWPLPSVCSITQLCDSCVPEFSPAARAEVIDCPSCSENFTSCLSYNVSLGMESCRRGIQIGCFIAPETGSMSAPIQSNNNTCSLAREPSDLEENFIITKLVTNCTAPGSCNGAFITAAETTATPTTLSPTTLSPTTLSPTTLSPTTQSPSPTTQSPSPTTDNNDEMTGGVIGGVFGAVGGVFLVAITFIIIIGIWKRWWIKIWRKMLQRAKNLVTRNE